MVDPDPPSVEQAGTYSSTCLISCLPLLAVSCNNRNHTVQESFPINMDRTFMGAFNAEVASLSRTTLTSYPHVSPILLASSSGGALEAAFDDMSLFPLKSWESRTGSSSAASLGYLVFHHLSSATTLLNTGLES